MAIMKDENEFPEIAAELAALTDFKAGFRAGYREGFKVGRQQPMEKDQGYTYHPFGVSIPVLEPSYPGDKPIFRATIEPPQIMMQAEELTLAAPGNVLKDLYIHELRIGTMSMAASDHEAPASFFEKLRKLRGHLLGPGYPITLFVRNESGKEFPLSGVFYGKVVT